MKPARRSSSGAPQSTMRPDEFGFEVGVSLAFVCGGMTHQALLLSDPPSKMEARVGDIPQMALDVAQRGREACPAGVTCIDSSKDGYRCAYVPLGELRLPEHITNHIAQCVVGEADFHWFVHVHSERVDVYKVCCKTVLKHEARGRIAAAITGHLVRCRRARARHSVSTIRGALSGRLVRRARQSF